MNEREELLLSEMTHSRKGRACQMPDAPEKAAEGWTEELVEEQVREDLDSGRIYRLNDRFFKFLFGGEDRKHLFLDLVNALVCG